MSAYTPPLNQGTFHPWMARPRRRRAAAAAAGALLLGSDRSVDSRQVEAAAPAAARRVQLSASLRPVRG
jgi:hypothetical protein